MHLTPMMLVVPALIAPANNPPPKMPTPTPGLGRFAQEINFAILKDGIVVKVVKVDGREYTVRGYSNFLALYNDIGHAIIIVRALEMEIHYAAGAAEGDPFPQKGQMGQIYLDGITYTVKYVPNEDGMAIAVYNEKGHIVFAMANPNMEETYAPVKQMET